MKLAFLASKSVKAQRALKSLVKRYGNHELNQADVVVPLGGDGFMLHSLHQLMEKSTPVFGLSRGTVGFLMNAYREDDLIERISKAKDTVLHPLEMKAFQVNGQIKESLAINEVSLLRQTKQSAHIKVKINEDTKIERLVGDGIMVATPAGSTAYNLSAHGPVIPMGSEILAVTPISPFRPRRWRGAIIPSHAVVSFEILSHRKRPVSATSDNFEVRHVCRVDIRARKDIGIHVLYDPQHNLEDRILNEQFE
ncbi:NAD kinase [Marinicella rhabdoformis]|uniref:NAD kinase n=1 Tax=Marinicella rhabdoformis TaxID=2580566 RepID=UPI0012AEB546|nr:NAD kinase [Marinicella rhabdoformis]